jgi:5-hydroxyisourate hydrolase
MARIVKRVSTHVLDVARGKPAQHVPVRLEGKDTSGNWSLLAASQTDADGRCAQLLSENVELNPGVYRLTFETASYQLAHNIDTLYPVVVVTFQVREGESHFHLPLLLSPHGYTTYRGT